VLIFIVFKKKKKKNDGVDIQIIIFFFSFQGVPLESHPSKLVGSADYQNRYFDFDMLAEVWFFFQTIHMLQLYNFTFSRSN
jgi:hypothetical protein